MACCDCLETLGSGCGCMCCRRLPRQARQLEVSSPVSGPTSPVFSRTAVPPSGFSCLRANMNVPETNQYLRSQLATSSQQFRELTEKSHTSKATVCCLADHLQMHKCEKYKDLMESVLGEKPRFEEGEKAEKPRVAARLGEYDFLIQAQARELTHLRQRIQEIRDICNLFTQHARNTVKSFEVLLKSTSIAYHQGQRFCEQLVQGSQLADSLASKLTTGNNKCWRYKKILSNLKKA
ncbi:NBPF family member NBPF6-like protein isoform X2 [Tamandua tetradactyla]|uniref:NBPF family member NBPF6-like protein isoform X2 n=1 Tax=Tamandua tetradactyla TaxID=48850 RepID=UPI004053A400